MTVLPATLSFPLDPALEAALRASAEAVLPAIQVSPALEKLCTSG